KASIGIAMGLSGTDVAKEAAEMILADDNFVTVVSAIEEGRIVFRNVKQTASYLFMTNMGETAAVLATLITGLPLPLLPAQILWMNLVTDGFCDVALATERGHEDVLADPPRKRNAPVITKNTWILAIMTAVLMSSGTVLLFVGALRQHGLEYARTVDFTTMAVFQLWNVLNMRSASKSLFSLGLGSNRYVLGAIAASLLLQLLIIYLPFF
ncbi:MAG: cation transporting ATPase C-terminal domain-containing protein, partial [Patescibacteria group bacterium]